MPVNVRTVVHRSVTLTAILCVWLAGCSRGPELVRRPASPPSALLIQDVSVLDVETGNLALHRNVLVSGGRIEKIGGSDIAAPDGAQTINGEGATLLPGLIDMHGHVGGSSAPPWMATFPDAERNLRTFLYCGVTTVLDPGDLATQAFDRRDRVARGESLGPRIYAAGPLFTTPGGHPVALFQRSLPWYLRWYLVPRFTRQVGTAEEARASVSEVVDLGADVIKIAVDRIPEQAPLISSDVLAAIVREANRRSVRAVAHIGSTQDALDAARAGISAWMHGVYKERIPDDRISELASFGIPMVPTMVVFESYAHVGQGPRVPTQLERETVEASTLAAFDPIPKDFDLSFFDEYLANLRNQRQSWRDNVRRLHAAGVTMFAGSDPQGGVFPGAALHRELALLTEAGFSPADAIRAATLDPAKFLANGKEPDFGIVAEGKRADLLLVEGDPTRSIEALGHIRAVINDGVALERIPITEQK